MSDVIQKVEDPHLVEGDASYPNLGVYSFGRGVFKKPNIEGFSTSATTLYRVRTGQFIYSRLFAFEGAYGMVPEDFDGYFVSNEYPTFACNGQIKAEFLYAYFKSPNVWMKVAEGSKGIGHRRQRVQPDRILAHRLMLPPLESQEKIASVLRKTDAAKEAHAETATELDAMLPSILDKAFKGDLL